MTLPLVVRGLRRALDAGMSWHAAGVATSIPYSTVKKHARLMGYEPHVQSKTAAAGHVEIQPG